MSIPVLQRKKFDARTPLYPDFNAGLLYYALFYENSRFLLGAAMTHIIEPSISLMNNTSEKLYRRWVGNIGGELPLNNELSLSPGVIVMGQGRWKQLWVPISVTAIMTGGK